MTRGRKIAVIVGVGMVLLIGSGLTYAGMRRHLGGQHFGHMGKGHFSEHFLAMAKRHLNLTDAQETQIRGMIDAEKPKIQPLVAQLAETHKTLNTLGADGQFNEAAVTDLANKQAATMASLVVEHERLRSQIFSVLTPEQRDKAKAFQNHVMGEIHKHLSE